MADKTATSVSITDAEIESEATSLNEAIERLRGLEQEAVEVRNEIAERRGRLHLYQALLTRSQDA
jgi:hypothetical protein